MNVDTNPPESNPGIESYAVETITSQAAQEVWRQCLALISKRVNGQTYKTWFEPIIPQRIDRGCLFVQVPSQFFYEWIEEHHYSLLNEILAQVGGSDIRLEYVIARDESDGQGMDSPAFTAPAADVDLFGNPPEKAERAAQPPAARPAAAAFLNARYTFDNYIKGESNQFARAAALAVANNPGGTSFNPLVIYGGAGLGKTHLVHAIGNHCRATGRIQRVLYVSSEKFTVDFVDSIQKDSVGEFSSFYRGVDLLIVDDIQFFAGKEKTQDYFFHTFNELHQKGKQIVLSCDKPPKDLKGLNDRLISRFNWGLMADIQPPDLETRIAILQKKSADEGVELEPEVVEFIATNVTTNIRELEGCLVGLLARASLESKPLCLELARDVVRSVIGEVRSHVTIEDIQRTVCEHLSIQEDLIRAKTRKQEVVNARQIAMYLAKELTNSSLKTIGLHFGGRDHSTVIHAYQSVEDNMNNDNQQRQIVQQIRRKLETRIAR